MIGRGSVIENSVIGVRAQHRRERHDPQLLHHGGRLLRAAPAARRERPRSAARASASGPTRSSRTRSSTRTPGSAATCRIVNEAGIVDSEEMPTHVIRDGDRRDPQVQSILRDGLVDLTRTCIGRVSMRSQTVDRWISAGTTDRHRPDWRCRSMSDWAIRVKDLRKQYPGRDGPVDAVNGIDLEIRRRRVLRAARPQRRGQDDDRRDPRGAEPADLGRGRGPRPALGRPTRRRSASGSASRSRRRGSPTRRPSARWSASSAASTATGSSPTRCSRGSRWRARRTPSSSSSPAASSSGWRSRVALVGDPELLFLDEPTTGLDPQSRRQLWDVIRDLRGAGPDDRPDDPLHGRGRAALRPGGDHRPRQDHRAGLARRADRPARRRAHRRVRRSRRWPAARAVRPSPALDSVLAARAEGDGYCADRRRAAPGHPRPARRARRPGPRRWPG